MNNSPLLRMPAEIRCMIYSYVLLEPAPIRLRTRIRTTPPSMIREQPADDGEDEDEPHRPVVRLFEVCRQIRMEAREHYFQINTLSISAVSWHNATYPAMLAWSQSLGDTHLIQCVRRVTLHYYLPYRTNLPEWRELQKLVGLFQRNASIKIEVSLFKQGQMNTAALGSPRPFSCITFEYGDRAVARQNVESWKAVHVHPFRCQNSAYACLDYIAGQLDQWVSQMPAK